MRIRISTNVYKRQLVRVAVNFTARRHSLSGPRWPAGRAEITGPCYIYSYADPGGHVFKTGVCGSSLTGIVGSNPTEGISVRLTWVLCCQVEVSGTSWSLFQRSPTECVWVPEYDREDSIMRRPWSNGGCCAVKENVHILWHISINR